MATSSIFSNIYIKTKSQAKSFCEALKAAEQYNKPHVHIITISGKAGHGKDYTATQMKSILEQQGKKVLIIHYADLLKYLCKSLFDWNGRKDEQGRHLLQYVGTDIVRKKQPDFWVDFIISILNLFDNEWDYVIIPDTRFPNEIEKLKCSGFQVTTFCVQRTNYDNGLTEEAKSHASENALNDYAFDAALVNNGASDYIQAICLAIDTLLEPLPLE